MKAWADVSNSDPVLAGVRKVFSVSILPMRIFVDFLRWNKFGKNGKDIRRVGIFLCVLKEDCGIGVRKLQHFNQALLAMQFWRLTQFPTSLLAQKFGVAFKASEERGSLDVHEPLIPLILPSGGRNVNLIGAMFSREIALAILALPRILYQCSDTSYWRSNERELTLKLSKNSYGLYLSLLRLGRRRAFKKLCYLWSFYGPITIPEMLCFMKATTPPKPPRSTYDSLPGRVGDIVFDDANCFASAISRHLPMFNLLSMLKYVQPMKEFSLLVR
ncbi:conserved hypothetical protein [Ricinus communis]|uniref:Uncharacterized protein n=1 Tax=Ricinus communis TaxID=3988 RepID=B9SCF6_RICCO|nr:conserved hypothetical protein [Ricinus communis]